MKRGRWMLQATFGSNVMEHKNPHMYSVCVSMYGVCSHVQYFFSQFISPFVAEAGTAPSIQLKSSSITSPTGGPGAATGVTPHAGLLPCSLKLCQFWLFLHSSLSGQKRET